jgi:hypothetical protein
MAVIASLSSFGKFLLTFSCILPVYLVFDSPSGSISFVLYYYIAHTLLLLVASYYLNGLVLISTKNLLVVLTFYGCALLWSLIQPRISVSFVAIWGVAAIGALILQSIAQLNSDNFQRAVNALIIISISGISIQAAIYLTTNNVTPLHSLLFPFSESKSAELERIGVVRLSGFYNEPGTYSLWMLALVYTSAKLAGRFLFLHAIALISIVLTLSVAGAILSCISFILIFAAHDSRKLNFRGLIVAGISLLVIVSLFVYAGGIEYLMWRFLGEEVVDGSTIGKVDTILHFWESDTARKVLGSGFFIIDCASCESVQDLGIGFNLIYQLGFFGGFVVLALLTTAARRGPLAIGWVLVLLLGKFYLYSMAAIFPTLLILGNRGHKSNE